MAIEEHVSLIGWRDKICEWVFIDCFVEVEGSRFAEGWPRMPIPECAHQKKLDEDRSMLKKIFRDASQKESENHHGLRNQVNDQKSERHGEKDLILVGDKVRRRKTIYVHKAL